MTRIFNKPSPGAAIRSGLNAFGDHVEADVKELLRDVTANEGAADLWKDVKNAALTFGGEAIGVVGLGGIRYPVSKYEFKVDARLSRGSRIDDPAGYATLKEAGFKSTVDLTLEGTRDATLGAAAGLHTLNVQILDNSPPTTLQMKAFLDFATKPENQPCYVHCQAGKGRTGVAVAVYRMAVNGWPAEKAIAEAQHFGCAMPDQIAFIAQFGSDLRHGAIAGYPVQPPLS